MDTVGEDVSTSDAEEAPTDGEAEEAFKMQHTN
jgi:hypothetical protein